MKLKHIAGLIFFGALSCAPIALAQQDQERAKHAASVETLLQEFTRRSKGEHEDVEWPDKLSTLKAIPSPDIIEKVKFNSNPSFEADGESHEQSFKKFMATATPLDADDPNTKYWHYAPWYSGSFVIKNETYFFRLFRGGRGELLTPQKEKGLFEFEPKFSAETLLREFKRAPHHIQQFEVGKKLVALGDKSVLPEMEKLLRAEDRKVRMNAGYVLAKLGDERGFFAVLSELTDRSYRPVKEDEGRNGDQSQGSRIVDDHYYAAHILWEIGDKRAVPALIEALKDPEIDYKAAAALGRLRDKRAVGPIREFLASDKGKSQRESIAYSLMWLGEEDGFQMILTQLKDPRHYSGRMNAALYLGEYGDKRAVPFLIEACKDTHPEVRSQAARALGQIGDPAALPVLRTLAAEPAELTHGPREAAAIAIKSIETRTKP